MNGFDFGVMKTAGNILLPLSVGAGILISFNDRSSVDTVLKRGAIACLLMISLGAFHHEIVSLSEALARNIDALGNTDGLGDTILERLKTQFEDKTVSEKAQNAVGAVTTLGVFAIAQLIADFFMAAAFYIYSSAEKIFIELIRFFAPLSVGIFPLFPRVFYSVLVLTIEVLLWVPILKIVQIASFSVVIDSIGNEGYGVSLLAAEIVVILLYASIPVFTHALVSGALNGSLFRAPGVVSLIHSSKNTFNQGGKGQ